MTQHTLIDATAEVDATAQQPASRRDQAAALRDRVRDHYVDPTKNHPGVVFLTEVNAPHSPRRADALALHLTKARPYVDGIEIKVSRSDWLSELDDHTKADAWAAYTHRWWLAVPDPQIVHTGELPDGWGLMVPNPRGRRMKTLVKPALREPMLDYAAVVEWLKKLDNTRADLVAEQVAEHVRRIRDDEARKHAARREQAPELSLTDRGALELGQLLVERTGMSAGQLALLLRHSPHLDVLLHGALALPTPTAANRDQHLAARMAEAAQDNRDKVEALTEAARILNPAGVSSDQD